MERTTFSKAYEPPQKLVFCTCKNFLTVSPILNNRFHLFISNNGSDVLGDFKEIECEYF